MEPTDIVYDICRHYIHDNKKALPDREYKRYLGLLRSRRYDLLASVGDFSAQDVTGAEHARVLLQIGAFFKKNSVFTNRLEARLSALLSFEEGELICKQTNARLDSHSAECEFSVEIEKMQLWISSVLGDVRGLLDFIPRGLEFTSGATATRSRRRAAPHLKISSRMVCTPGASKVWKVLEKYFSLPSLAFKLISLNRVTFVPKSWKTERTIACEADGNIPIQLAVDKYLKVLLRRKGFDLSDQTRNQELSRIGSITGDLATIDLSMASDTLSYNAVALLLPYEWFSFLRLLRSQKYEMYKGSIESYNKFSSMGNGFTFPLETLIFAAASVAVGGNTHSVYGDDIIIDSKVSSRFIALLEYLGFTVNQDKSFVHGPFKESCGKFWYNGVDVTPRYIRDVDGRKAVLSHLVNIMAEISSPYGSLSNYLKELCSSFRLPFVPYNEDSLTGVWVDTHTAYELGIISLSRKGKYAWCPRFKGFIPQSGTKYARSLRGYLMWHLRCHYGDSTRPWGIGSRYSTFSHKYVRKWVRWFPAVGAPEHLYWWSDHLILSERR